MFVDQDRRATMAESHEQPDRKPPQAASPTPTGPQLVTQLLADAQAGDARASGELFPIVYEELKRLAGRYMREESNAQTMQATALVHEAYLRLVGPNQPPWENRAHFFGAAARAIRRILTDHARARASIKRGSGARPVQLDEQLVVSSDVPENLIALEVALEKLSKIDEQKARVVELRFFAGLTVEQTAIALGISPSTVARDWQFTRVWLHKELTEQGSRDR